MSHSHFTTGIQAKFTRLAPWGWRQLRWVRRAMRAFLRTCAREIRRPGTQYRIALLLVAMLALVLSWSLILPHAETVAFRGNIF